MSRESWVRVDAFSSAFGMTESLDCREDQEKEVVVHSKGQLVTQHLVMELGMSQGKERGTWPCLI